MESRLVVGIDGSAAAAAAWEWASARASRTGVPLEQVTIREELGGALPEALAARSGPEVLLVIGTDKTGFIRGRVFGSRAAQLATLVEGDLAVIPRLDPRFRSGVVAGIDTERTAGRIAIAAAEAAAALGQPLLLLRADAEGDPVGGRAILERAARSASHRAPELKIRVRTSSRRPAEALLDAAAGAALLVIGPGSRGSRSTSRLGTVVHEVLINLNAPLLIVSDIPETSDSRDLGPDGHPSAHARMLPNSTKERS